MTDFILMICIAVFFIVFGTVFFWADKKTQQEEYKFYHPDYLQKKEFPVFKEVKENEKIQ